MVRQTRRRFLAGLAASTAALMVNRWAAAPSQAATEVGQLTGSVREMASGRPLADVLLSASSISSISDAGGRFTLALPAGRYDIGARATEYLAMTATDIAIRAGETTELTLEMIPIQPDAALAERIAELILANAGSGAPAAAAQSQAAVSALPATIRVVTNYTSPPPAGYLPAVVEMNLEEYLRGVVPSEMPANWHPAALQAQAVAARSYAVAGGAHYPYADVCTTTHCQYWSNARYYATTDAAINATRGIVAIYNGAVCNTFYFGHCDGHTRYPEEIRWFAPWCTSVPCTPCAAQGYTEYWGHGVGMCQEGAEGYAVAGWSYSQILQHYYTGINLSADVTLSLTSPAEGASVRGVVLAEVAVGGAPAYIDYFLDYYSGGSTPLYRATAAPWQMRLNTLTLADGAYTLRAVAVSPTTSATAVAHIVVDNTPPVGTASAPAGWLRSADIPLSLTWNADAYRVQCSNNWRWQGEGPELLHQAGTATADPFALNGAAWYGRENIDPANTWFGPYTCALPAPADYQAYYRLKARDRSATLLARLDVTDKYGARVLAQRSVWCEDLALNMAYEEVMLPFNYPEACSGSGGIELRTHYAANRDLYLDCITVYSAPRSLAPVITWRAAYRDGAQTILVRLLDRAGNACDASVTVQLDLTIPILTQTGANQATAQDGVSGLEPASARYAESADGGETWGPWQVLGGLSFSPGTIDLVTLSAPAGAAPDVRFMISDRAGNIAFTRGKETYMPNIANQTKA